MGKELTGRPLICILRSGSSPSTPLQHIVQFARGDCSTPREIAAVMSKKYHSVVYVTTKSFEPEAKKPSYQVHRIDTHYGKQSHLCTLHRKTGLLIASSSKSVDSGLSSAGEVLANAAIAGQSSSVGIADLSDDPLSTGLDALAASVV